MVPDLVNHALCGSTTNDVTNASTTQLLDVGTRSWSDELVTDLGLRRDLLPDLHEPGTDLGTVRGVDRHGRRLAGGRRRQPRHRERGRRCPAAPRPSGHLHLVWHVVAGRVRGRGPDHLGRGVVRERHQRAGSERHGAAAQERDRPLAARGVQADMGRRKGVRRDAAELVAAAAARPGRAQRDRPRRSPLRRARRHAGTNRRLLPPDGPAGSGVARRGDAHHPRLARPDLAHDGGHDRARRRLRGRGDPSRRGRFVDPAAARAAARARADGR